MLYFSRDVDVLTWHMEQLMEEGEKEATIKPVRVDRNIYLMKPDEEETDVAAEFADGIAKAIAVLDVYWCFLEGTGTNASFTNKKIDFLYSKFREQYKDREFREAFLYDPGVLKNFRKFLGKYRKIFGLTDFLKDTK